jgi:hypothetical protein
VAKNISAFNAGNARDCCGICVQPAVGGLSRGGTFARLG